MKDRHRFHGWNGLLSISLILVVILYLIVGFFGYMAFGVHSKMVLSNMPHHKWVYQVTKILYAIGIITTYNLQLYVPVQILFPPLKRKIGRRCFVNYGEYFIRTILVLITCKRVPQWNQLDSFIQFIFLTDLLAISVPCLEQMISLFGAFASTWLAFIVPPVIDLIARYHRNQYHRRTLWAMLKTCFILMFGFGGCFLGTSVAIKSIIAAISDPEKCT